jgi:small-conductance mechanosensitive channel
MANLLSSDYLVPVGIILGSLVLAKLVLSFLSVYVHRFVSKTKTTLDDEILKIMTKPFYFLVMAVGTEIAFFRVRELQAYKPQIIDAFFVIYVLVAALVLSKLVRLVMSHWLKVKGHYKNAPRLISNVVVVIIYVIVALVILSYFNIEITPMIATLGIGGLAIGLALQNTLANLFGGIHILSDRPINVGDFVEIGTDLTGYVEDIGWRTTRIRKLSNNFVVVPNSTLADSTIVNYSLPELETSCIVHCGVGYNEDLEKVEKATLKVAAKIQKTAEGAIRDFEPKVRFYEFGDSNINFRVIMRVERYVDRFVITSEFIKALKAEFTKQNIEISWPVRKIVKG